jgi:hypothetical protein
MESCCAATIRARVWQSRAPQGWFIGVQSVKSALQLVGPREAQRAAHLKLGKTVNIGIDNGVLSHNTRRPLNRAFEIDLQSAYQARS